MILQNFLKAKLPFTLLVFAYHPIKHVKKMTEYSSKHILCCVLAVFTTGPTLHYLLLTVPFQCALLQIHIWNSTVHARPNSRDIIQPVLFKQNFNGCFQMNPIGIIIQQYLMSALWLTQK